MGSTPPRCVVVGGYVLDVVVETAELPGWAMDTQASSIGTAPGGKALNQAVVLARSGAPTAAVGGVGNDPAGRTVLDALDRDDVDVSEMSVHTGIRTDTILVFKRPDGANAIVAHVSDELSPSASTIDRVAGSIRGADAVLMTFEAKPEALERAIWTAREGRALTVVTAAGAPPGEYAGLPWHEVDVLVANEQEARGLLGVGPDAPAAGLATDVGHRLGSRLVCVTLGSGGCRTWNGTDTRTYRGRPVAAVDTTAAGDTFTATLAERLAAGADERLAVTAALNASAETVCRSGGYVSLPPRAEYPGGRTVPHGTVDVETLVRAHEAMTTELDALIGRASSLASVSGEHPPTDERAGQALADLEALALRVRRELERGKQTLVGLAKVRHVAVATFNLDGYLDRLTVVEGQSVPLMETSVARAASDVVRAPTGSPEGDELAMGVKELRDRLDVLTARLAATAAHGIQLKVALRS